LFLGAVALFLVPFFHQRASPPRPQEPQPQQLAAAGGQASSVPVTKVCMCLFSSTIDRSIDRSSRSVG
jgi:hypothetical protein